MISSIKATIRALWVPEHRLNCPRALWRKIVADLERRGNHQHEAGCFLLGADWKGRRVVSEVIYYDELDPDAYSTGICILHGDAFAQLWAICREKKLTVVGDVHTHPGEAFQSHSDKTNPMVARTGHIAIILPNYARWPIPAEQLGVYEYRGRHEWVDRNPAHSPAFFYSGFWS
jgi:hypothetical protein